MIKICIRVDGNEIIATGHVMRCLSIAEQLRNMGAEVIFVVADERPCPIIEGQNFDTYVLNTVWNDMDAETECFCDFLMDNNISTVLLDSYFVTAQYIISVSRVAKICYIDDMNKFIYPVHTVVNYGLNYNGEYETRYRGVGLNTRFLVGCKYVPLRDEFSYKPYNVREKVNRVLITTGGTDQLGMSYALLEAFLGSELTAGLEYNVIVGRFNMDEDRLEKLSHQNSNIVLHKNVSNMSHWMRYCDVAISAAGTTKYELSACGIPSICFEVADNQEGAVEWERNGYMLYAGNAYIEKDECIKMCFKKLIDMLKDYELRKTMSLKMQKLVDGMGAKRISEHLLEM